MSFVSRDRERDKQDVRDRRDSQRCSTSLSSNAAVGKVEEVQTSARVSPAPVRCILANRQSPLAAPASENYNFYVEGLNDMRMTLTGFSNTR